MECFTIENNSSLVRIFHAAESSPPVDVYLNGNLLFSDISFRKFTKYVNLKEGEHKIDIYRVGETKKPVISEILEIGNGEIYTVAVTEDLEDLSLLVIPDYKKKFPSDKYSTFRIVHLSLNVPAVDILVDNEVLFKDINFREGTNYVDVNQGKYNIKIVKSSTDNIILPLKVILNTNRIYTIYVIGNIKKLEVIQSVDGNTYVCR